jgi:hypothetical protein
MTDTNNQCRRRDSSLAAVIELAIAYQQAHGYPHAKIYLMEQAVKPEVIRRVLSCPKSRRTASAPPS